MYQDHLRNQLIDSDRILTQVESLLKVIDLKIQFYSLDVLRELLKIGTDFTLTLADVDEIKLTAQNSDFLVEEIDFLMMSLIELLKRLLQLLINLLLHLYENISKFRYTEFLNLQFVLHASGSSFSNPTSSCLSLALLAVYLLYFKPFVG